MELPVIELKIKNCLEKLYEEEQSLFSRNKGQGICERCLVFRFAHYLQNEFAEYFVDCDFNSSSINGSERLGKPIIDQNGLSTVSTSTGKSRSGKPITDQNGRGSTKRFIDIIVHKRTFDRNSDLICFEIKKWNNHNREDFYKDINNLKVLTSEYGYEYGFHLIFGENKEETKWTIWQRGENIGESIFKNVKIQSK